MPFWAKEYKEIGNPPLSPFRKGGFINEMKKERFPSFLKRG